MASVLDDIALVDSDGGGRLKVTVGGTEALTVTAAGGGRIGVLQTSPALPLHVGGSGTLGLPSGTTGQRPAVPSAGMMRWNSDIPAVEGFDGSTWRTLGPSYGSAGVVVVDQSLNVGTPTFTVTLPEPGGMVRTTITGVDVNAWQRIRLRFYVDAIWRGGRTYAHATDPQTASWWRDVWDGTPEFEVTKWELGPNWLGSLDMLAADGSAWGSVTVWNWGASRVMCFEFAGWYDASGNGRLDRIEVSTSDGSNLDSGWITVVQWTG